MFASRNAVPMILGVVAVIATGFTSTGAQAQQASLLEEIVVTARMRAENLQEVPVTVSVFTAADIDQIGVSSMRDYAQLVPNFFLVETQNSSFAFVNIRGITQMRNLDPSVAIMIDGVLSTNPISMSQELFDIEQIEVLKGPQGALYGRSAVGGAINITTKRPTNEFEGFVRVGLGDGDASKLQASISGPLVEDRVFGRLSASFYDADGWRDNVVVGQKSDPVENKSARGRLIFTPNDTFEADLRFSVSEDNLSALGFVDLAPVWAPFAGDPSVSLGCGAGIFPAASIPCVSGPVDIGTPIPPFTPNNPDAGVFQGDINNTSVPQQSNLIGIDERELTSISALLKWEFDSGTLISVTSFDSAEDAAWGEQPPRTQIAAFTNSQWRDTDTVSQEIRFTSSADQRLRWITGAYFLETESFLSTTIQRDALGVDTLQFFVKDNPEPQQCNFAAGFPFPGSAADTPTNCVVGFDGDEQDNSAFAVFAQINYDLTDDLELSLSGRYDEDKREQTIRTPDVFLSFFAAGNPGLVFGAVRSTTFDSFQPKATLRWTPQDNVMLYASYAEGFRSGGFNRPGIQARADALRGTPGAPIPLGIFDIYPQQDTSSIEAGFKWNSTDGRWVLNGSAFFTEVDDYQSFTFNGRLNGSQIIIPIDEVEINGIELDFTGRLTDALTLNVGVAVNDSEITAESFRGFVGNEAPQTPDHTLNIGLQYEDPDGRFFVRGDFQQIGEVFFMPANWVARDELDLINLRGGVNLGSDQSLQLVIWCDNCTDENYFGEGFNDSGLVFYGRLRRAGVELTKRF